MMAEAVAEAIRRQTARPAPEFRGAALAIQAERAHEWIISGPSETGKTFATLSRLDRLMREYPGAQAAMVRKTYKSMTGSVLQTWEKKVIAGAPDVSIYGGSRPEWYDYANGSRVFIGGMDNPDKLLSSERDFVYVNQAEELTLDDWEKLTTRATGRAANAPYAMVFGDCNPGAATHWILRRAALKVLHSRHEDNPTLYDAAGVITARGLATMAVLDALTGVRRERLRHGRWVSAEGAVYEFDPGLHEVDAFPVPAEWRRVRVIDFGYTNPFVCQWWACDPDGRMYLYREMYMSGRTVRAHAAQINALSAGETYDSTVVDHDAEDRATLAESGIYTQAAYKDIGVGVQRVQERLRPAGDGRPRLYVMRGALVEQDARLAEARKPTCTRDEFDVYMWPKAQDGRPVKEAPVKENDHGMDALRYAVMYFDRGRPVGIAEL